MNNATIEQPGNLDFIANEAINTICSNLFFAGRNLKKILITSFSATAGKSFVAQQMLWNIAKRGKRIVLIDTDLRRSKMVTDLSFKTAEQINGLAQYLAGYCSLDDALYVTNIAHSVVMPIGRIVKNPVALLGLPQFPEMLDELADNFDIVLIDTPPIGLVIDAAEIAKHCDGAMVVVEYDQTRRKELITARNMIEQTGCPILGCVINKVKSDTLGARRYYNYSGYYGSYK